MTECKAKPDSLNKADGDVKLDEIDALWYRTQDFYSYRMDKEMFKSGLLTLKSKWEAEAYKKGYIDGGINQLTNGDK